MKQKLQLKEIVGYLPYELIIANKSLKGEIINTYTMGVNAGEDSILNVLFGVNQIPILFPISSLAEFREDLGFIPMVELAKIANLDITKYVISKTNNAYDIRCNIENEEDSDTHEVLGFDLANGFGHHYRLSQMWTIISNQFELWEKLYEWKIDVHNLIEKGLAIEVTQEFNPYK